MLVSLNWIRDFITLPADIDPIELARKLTMITAEVEGVEHIVVNSRDLIAAEVVACEPVDGDRPLWRATLWAGDARYETVTAASGLAAGQRLVYAPPGATVDAIGQVGVTQVAGLTSQGMIVPGEAIGIHQAHQKAVLLPPSVKQIGRASCRERV